MDDGIVEPELLVPPLQAFRRGPRPRLIQRKGQRANGASSRVPDWLFRAAYWPVNAIMAPLSVQYLNGGM